MKQKFGLNNNQLKIIAMLTMLLDHAGRQLFPQTEILIIIGRIAFPVFAYMIAEGCTYTKNKKKYLLIMAGMGIGCQIVYFITSGSLYMNVLLTFVLSILCIYAGDLFRRSKTLKNGAILLITVLSVIFLCSILPQIISHTDYRIDYGLAGVMLPVAVFFAKKKSHKIIAACAMLVLLALTINTVQWFGFLAIPLLILYSGERGKKNLKLLFYIFYPAHLVVIYLISLIM